MGTDLPPTWDQLLGSGDWEGLVEPVLHPDFRKLILRCGNFSQATLDAFNNDAGSKYAGSSRYDKEGFFDKLMLDSASDYEVKALLYAAPDLGFLSVFIPQKVPGSWDKPFELIKGWSVALARKDSDFLKEEYLIPASWWVEKNKGMVRDPHKGWILVQDEPVPET
ncbi:phospholipase A1-IIdelta-like [Henckelia pumila]|uniref:phospholipase A1-IIdelta-like n=1 Tax=Henckelia pumila TaxID=405737 RepID=UPI003C6E2A4C